MTGLEAPAIIGIIGAATAVIGTGVAVYGQIQAQGAQSAAAQSEQLARESEAANAREAARYEESQFRRRAALLIGKTTAIQAASGFDIASGSPLINEISNIQQAELEALNIRRMGAVSASGREFEGRLAGMRGSFARSQMFPTALGGVARGASSILGAWATYSSARPPSYYDPGYANMLN